MRFALLSAFVIAFAQIAVAAEAWPAGAALNQHTAAAQPTNAADATEHCPGHTIGADSAPFGPQAPVPGPNYCEVHCQDAAQPDALVVAVSAPLPDAGLLVPPTEAEVVRDAAANPMDAKCASPPARLLFARFQI